MSGYARVATQLGAAVSGSDRADSPACGRCARSASRSTSATTPANVPAGEGVEVVHSTAIPPDNPERAAARERGLPDLPRAELLAQLSALKRTIAVAGAHGKTTTTSMTAHVLLRCGLRAGLPHRRGADDRPGSTPTGERGSGSWSRPTSPTARCSRCTPTSRW